MFQTIFATQHLPRQDRLAQFDQLQTSSGHPMRAFSDAAERFSARIDALDLGAVNIVHLTLSPTQVLRTHRQVSECDPDLYSIVLPLQGRLRLEQAGQRAALEKGTFALYTSSQPFQVQIEAPGGPDARPGPDEMASLLRVQVPKALFPLTDSQVDLVLAQPVAGTAGVGALLTGFLAQLLTDPDGYTEADRPRLGNLVVDLMSATLAHQLDARLPMAPAESTLMARIVAFIEHNLGDRELSPSAIAAAHHISVSYLHRLFRTREVTVGTFVRTLRLERARRDLTDPRLSEVPIHRVAARWGFGDHATFTRAFRAGFGLTPSDYRNATELSPGVDRPTHTTVPGSTFTRSSAGARHNSAHGPRLAGEAVTRR